ncbi:MAG: Hpt domain-containing protein [Pseudomonadota bacterium]
MSQDREHFALEWIKSDLLETLDSARMALEAYSEANDDETRLRTCLTSLHQIHGTLVMLELNGVGRLAEHLEKLAQGLLNGAVPLADGPVQTLMQGILELPGYLEELQKGLTDSDQPFITLINEARGFLGLELEAEPPRNPLDGQTTEAALQRFERIEGLSKARKIRSAYQQVLLAILKGQDREQAVVTLGKVAHGLRRICEGTPHEAQWQAFGEFVESLGRRSGPLDADAIRLLRRTDAEIRSLATEGTTALKRPVNRALVQLLLDQAEERDHSSETVTDLRTALDAGAPVDGLVISGRQALASAALALRDDLAQLKDRIDIDVRAGTVSRDSLAALIEPLGRIGSTLNLLGFQSSHASLVDQIETINDCLVTGEFDLPTLQGVAATLLQVDETLASATRGARGQGEVERITSEAHRAVAQEARTGLDEVKQAIVDYVSSSFDYALLAPIPHILDTVCGALDMVPLARPARQLGDCRELIVGDLKRRTPGWEALDHLADAISGVDYYLERLIEDSSASVENVLDMVDRSLEECRRELSAAPQVAEPLDAAATDDIDVVDAGPVTDSTVDEAESLFAIPGGLEPADDQLAPSEPTTSKPTTAEPAGADEPVELTPLEEITAAEAQALDVVDSFPEDEDIAEIFVEEVNEVLAELDQQLSLLIANPEEQDPLVIARRAFHTLKGSGRMVGANTIGELAWSVEQMFNKVLDGQLECNVRLIEAAARARALVPELLSSFEARQPAPQAAVVEVIAQVDALRSGTAEPDAGKIVLDESDLDALAEQDLLPPVTAENFLDLDTLDLDQVSDAEPPAAEEAQTLDALPTFTESDALAEEDSESDLEEALQVFIDEAREHSNTLRAQLLDGRFEPSEDALRALHTLAGSASIAGIDTLAELARPVYELGRALRTQHRVSDVAATDIAQLMGNFVDAVAQDLELLASGDPVDGNPELVARAEALLESLDQNNEAHQLLSIEGLSTLFDAGDYLRQWRSGGQDLAFAEALKSTLDRLAERAGSLEQVALAGFGQTLNRVHDNFLDLELPQDAFETLEAAHDRLLKYLDALVAEQDPMDLAQAEAALARLLPQDQEQPTADLDAVAPAAEPEAGAVEADDTLIELPADTDPLAPALDAAAAELPADAAELAASDDELLAAAGDVVDADAAETVGPDASTPVTAEDDALIDVEDLQLFDTEVGAAATEDADEPISAALSDEQRDEEPVTDEPLAVEAAAEEAGTDEQPLDSVVGESDADTLIEDLIGMSLEEGLEPEIVDPASAEPAVAAADLSTDLGDDAAEQDPEIVAIFVEEAEEILETFEDSVTALARERDNQLHIENMLRGLHTLKGGARLAGLTVLGDRTHQLESSLIERQSAGPIVADDEFVAFLQRELDDLVTMVNAAQGIESGAAEAPATPADEPQVAEDATAGTFAAEPANEPLESADSDAAADSAEVVPLVPAAPKLTAAEATPANRTARDESGRQLPERTPQEVVRVGASVLEELVNLAGESSILRARIEQGLGDFTGALDEMETTIGRVREQLRRLEIETEAQILFRQERFEGPAHDDFDPLEMDRYSQLQQLSRALTESASDMLDLKETLLYKARESETLLLQQARINTELQEGLMRTRMVPFSRLLPRLRRIVRQVAGELGKNVEFHAYNAEGELDRSLLERMIPPLEHMLRNAVDHGIETAAERASFGKTDNGQIDLRLSREGGDVLIEIADDGAGIDVESVRAKAIERGLLEPNADLRDEEVLQFILAPGFTTAKSVTQISGRGVGMDVVNSEVKQLGGTVSIASTPGRGTRISLRIPFTVSVNRALMVSVGEDLYAIPLNTIEGIVLLGPQELEKLYASDSKPFQYAGISYQVRYLGHYLGREYRGNPSQSSAPVVLVRAGDQSVAIHVDAVQGSREIVVKSLGPQFAGVGGISGATILGDGSVVVILDLLALIRLRSQQSRTPGKKSGLHSSRTRCVMVVDDSVTVRKVTSRLLERQGMDVLVAKDGVEAVALLQERRPDIMLLDIEMPRMDGFEVARQIRHDEQLDGLPIVMISSRTGDKHQERATELGVNRFLGKPFQESELLETIDQLVQS